MKDSSRRMVIFVVIVLFGSVMIFFDLPVFYLLIGAVMLGILVLFLTGTLKVPSFKRGAGSGKQKSAQAPEKEEKAKKAQAKAREKKEKTKKAPEKIKGKKRSSGEFFSSLKGAFSVLGKDLKRAGRSRKEKEDDEKKIDEMLNRSVAGSEIATLDDIVPEAVPAERKKTSDPFTALISDDLNEDLLNNVNIEEDTSLLDDAGIDEELKIPDEGLLSGEEDFSKMDIGLSDEEIPVTLDETDDSDEVKEILDAHHDEIGITDGEEEIFSPADEDIEGLEGLDIEDIDLEEESQVTAPGKESSEKTPQPAPASPEKAAPQKAAAPAMSGVSEMLSFGTGKRQDDDLMSSLKSDAKSVKKSEYASLIRDLKDVYTDASDLEKELEDLLKIRNPKAGEK